MSEVENPALVFQRGDEVRHRSYPDRAMWVTNVDEQRGRWVCCRRRTAPDAWHQEQFKPEDLVLKHREQESQVEVLEDAGNAPLALKLPDGE